MNTKKTFTLFLLSALAAAPACAQGQLSAGRQTANAAAPQLMSGSEAVVASLQKRIELENDERVMGFYDTDDLPYGENTQGWSNYPDQTIYVGNVFEEDITGKFVGGKITKVRFGIADTNTAVSCVYVMEITNRNYGIAGFSPVSQTDLTGVTLEYGWNEITLDEPVEIKANKWYIIGYGYYQKSNNYPIFTDGTLKTSYTSQYGFISYFYFPTAKKWDWYSNNTRGQACIQAVVQGGNFAEKDITLLDLSADKYAGVGGEINYSFNVKNYGNVTPETYSINVAVDGEVVETLNTPVALTNIAQNVSGSVSISGIDTSVLDHSLKIYVDKIDGETPTEATDDDTLEAAFKIYTTTATRQMHLIEQFTSVYCGFCPLGHNVIEKLLAREEGKYAWVAMHGLMMGSDPLYCSDMYNVENFFGITGYPKAAFDRATLNDNEINPSRDVAIIISYGMEAGDGINGYVENEETEEYCARLIDEAVDAFYASVPAFVSVDIAADYDSSSRKLDITVSGSGAEIAKDLLSDATLTVYLTEDGIDNIQEDYVYGPSGNNNILSSYTHNNVFRKAVSLDRGDAIGWTSDSAYSNSYSVTLDASWDAANINIVAFVSGAMTETQSDGTLDFADLSGAYVNNCNMLRLSETTGIENVNTTVPTAANEYYTIDGRRINAPAKGLNIVKAADGTVKKVIIK